MPRSNKCGLCLKRTTNKQKAVQCDVCNNWIHAKCNNITNIEYESMASNDDIWSCRKCETETIPFMEVSDGLLKLTLQGKNCSTFLDSPIIEPNRHMDCLRP